MNKEIPVLFVFKDECCGCGVCVAKCPVSAISMVEDTEGFQYPYIDSEKCIRCGSCINVCPFKNAE